MPIVFTGVLTVAALGAWFVVDQVLPADDGCGVPTVVRVAADTDIAPAVTQVARNLGGQDDCYKYEVQARDSTAVAESLAISDGSERPHVWIPESTLRLQRADGLGAAEVPESGISIASSPVVLALDEDAAGELGWPSAALSWSDVLGSSAITLGMPDPARDPVGGAALLGVRTVTNGQSDPNAAYTSVLRRFSPNTASASADLYARLPGTDSPEQPVRAFPVTEASLLRYNVKQTNDQLVAAYPAASVPAMDFPFTVLTGTAQAERTGADKLLRALREQSGAAALADAGFRTPDGRMLRDRSQDKRVSNQTIPPAAMPPDNTLDEVLNVWAGVNLSSRTRVLIDVSGSMNAIVPGTGKTRMELTTDAAARGLALFKPTSKTSTWTFATELDGDRDYREILPMAQVSEQLKNGAQDKMRAIKATAQGQTGLYDTVLAAYQLSRQEWEAGRLNLVIVMTDGIGDDPNGITRPDLLSRLASLQDPKRPLPIIIIGIGPGIDKAELDAISDPTGGKTFVAPDPTRINEVFFSALSKLAGNG